MYLKMLFFFNDWYYSCISDNPLRLQNIENDNDNDDKIKTYNMILTQQKVSALSSDKID